MAKIKTKSEEDESCRVGLDASWQEAGLNNEGFISMWLKSLGSSVYYNRLFVSGAL